MLLFSSNRRSITIDTGHCCRRLSVGAQPRHPGVSAPIAAIRETTDYDPLMTPTDVHDGGGTLSDALPPAGTIEATAAHLSADLDLEPASESALSDAVQRRDRAVLHERSIPASHNNELYLSELAKRLRNLLCQISYAAEPSRTRPVPNRGVGVREVGRCSSALGGNARYSHTRVRSHLFLGRH